VVSGTWWLQLDASLKRGRTPVGLRRRASSRGGATPAPGRARRDSDDARARKEEPPRARGCALGVPVRIESDRLKPSRLRRAEPAWSAGSTPPTFGVDSSRTPARERPAIRLRGLLRGRAIALRRRRSHDVTSARERCDYSPTFPRARCCPFCEEVVERCRRLTRPLVQVPDGSPRTRLAFEVGNDPQHGQP
jgi:hypothetical protein